MTINILKSKKLMTKIILVLSVLLPFSCDSMKTEGLTDGSIKFLGISNIQYTQEGSYIFSWEAAETNAKIQYYLYFQDLGESNSNETGNLALQTSGTRSFYKENLNPSIDPLVKGQLLDTIESTKLSYKLQTILKPNHSYAFFVRSKSEDGKFDDNKSVYILNKIDSNNYIGCESAISESPATMRVSLQFPEEAQHVNIYRNNVLIATIETPSNTIFVDQDLKIDTEYQYRCEAITGNEILVGTNQPKSKTLNPLTGYQGCTSAKIQGNYIALEFEYPENASEVHLYRNGLLVHSSNSSAGTKFIDSNALPGNVYTYSCEAIVDGIAAIGTKKIKANLPDTLAHFNGCLDAKALGSSDIKIDFQIPSNAEELIVYRNGVKVFKTSQKDVTSFIDNGLDEGLTYKYNCSAILGKIEKIGQEDFSVSTISTNAPLFSGISDVKIIDSHTAELSWKLPSNDGVIAAKYRIYSTVGNLVEWGGSPTKIINSGTIANIVENLGDELPYSFGIRACSLQDNCDTNTVMIRKNTPDAGPPRSNGADSVEIVNGELSILAPWVASDGAILKRKIYLRTGETGGVNISNYTLAKTVIVSDIADPPTTLKIGGISENTKYHIIVVDEDPSGQSNSPDKFLTIETGDLTAPSFTGIAGIKIGLTNKEATTLTVEFNSVEIETDTVQDGASDYLFYLAAGKINACKEGELYDTVSANNFAVSELVSYTISNLSEKKLYSVCIKAKDQSGNISNTGTYLSKYTLDKTTPNFDGVQSVEYDPSNGKIDVKWNTSPDQDTMEYKIKVWKNASSPSENEIEFFVKNANEFKAGFYVSQSDFPFIGNDSLYVLVDACDNAHLIPDGVQNCTQSSIPFIYQVPDVTPPQGFSGIQGSNLIQTPVEGEIEVSWKAPEGGDWNDYRGFKIYHIDLSKEDITDDDLIFLADCPCSDKNCPDQRQTCSIAGLDPYRTYNLHVRAYDAVGNITTYLNPSVFTVSKRTSDTTPPSFSSGLQATYDQAAIHLSWNSATDNQYQLEPDAQIIYKLYRRTGSTFSIPNDPTYNTDTELLSTDTSNSFIDTNISSNISYFYTVCASDSTNNTKCDGAIRNIVTPDVIPPEVKNITSNKEQDENLKVWNLHWDIVDNSESSTVRITVKYLISDSKNAPTDINQYIDFLASDEGLIDLENLVGMTNENKWVHYLLIAQDRSGNKGYGYYSIFSQNKVEITAVKRASGPTTGNKFIIVEGAGFADGASIEIGGQNCADTQFYTTSKLGCYTPALTQGSYTVTITNPNGTGFDSMANAYTYYPPENANLSLCDHPSNQEIYFVRNDTTYAFPEGDGSLGSPFVICNGEQLNKIRTINYNKYFKLGDNIDLRSFTDNSFLPLKFANHTYMYTFKFYGEGLYIANWTYQSPAENYVGLFGVINGDSYVENLNLVNFNIEGNSQVGLLAGHVNRGNCSPALNNISVHGNVLGHSHFVGGAVGLLYYGGVSNVFTEVKVEGDYNSTDPGTYRYRIGGFAGSNEVTCNHSDIHVLGEIRSANHLLVGGIYGLLRSHLSNSSFKGKIISNTPILGRNGVGGITGNLGNGSTPALQITNCQAEVKIEGNMDRVGGFVGEYSGYAEITNSSVTGTIIGRSAVGGFVGFLYAHRNPILNNNIAETNIQSDSNQIGGFIGQIYTHHSYTFDFTVTNNTARGNITGNENIGGFIGYADCSSGYCSSSSTVSRNQAHVNVESASDNTGGFIGQLYATPDTLVLKENLSTGSAKGKKCIGGFIGYNLGSIEDSYSLGDVTADDYGGGFAGCTATYTSYAANTIKRSYALGKVNKGLGSSFGGFTAHSGHWSGQFYQNIYESLFWDTQSSKMDTTKGDLENIFGITSTDMKDKNIFISAGWDFTPNTGIWEMRVNGTSPRLRWENE